MDHYIDIRLLPDPELAEAELMNALFGKLHRMLVARAAGGPSDIGISFPHLHGRRLGDVLRLHGQAQALEALQTGDWLAGMRAHVALEAARPVPAETRHRVVRRVQVKSSAARLRRRLMRRHGLDETEATQRIPDTVEKRLDWPYVQLHSASTGQQFKLFVAHGPLVDVPRSGRFSTYGLSDEATVPWF